MTISTSTVSYATSSGQGTLVFLASDGTACVLWSDGTDQKFSYASSPYTSWTHSTLVTGQNMALAGKMRGTSIDVVTGAAASMQPQYYPLTKSGVTYSLGTSNSIRATTMGTAGVGNSIVYAGQDAQLRHWIISGGPSPYTGSKTDFSPASSPTGVWTAHDTTTITANQGLPAGDQIGNFLVLITWNGTNYRWRRLDNSAASIGTIDTAANIPNIGGAPTVNDRVCFRTLSATKAMLVYSSGSGIFAQTYDPSADTFSANTQLSSNANDRTPTIATDGAGNCWAIWCSFQAGFNYSLVYKKYNGSTWDAGATTLVAAGTNIANPNAGYGNTTIGVAYTVGTATPWTVGFASVSLLTNNTMSAEDDLSVADSLLIPSLDFFSDTLPVTDKLLIPSLDFFSDALSVASSLLATKSWSLTESLTVTDEPPVVELLLMADTLLGTDGALFTDGLSGASSLTVQIITVAPMEIFLASEMALLIDPLSAADSLSITGSVLMTETPPLGDVFIGLDGALAIDGISVADSGNMQAQNVDGLIVTESAVFTGSVLPTDGLVVDDSLALFAQAGLSTDALSPLDSLFVVESAFLTETNTATSGLLGMDGWVTVEANTVGDVFSGQGGLVGVDGLVVAESATFASLALPIDGLVAFESVLASGASVLVEGLVSADSQLLMDTYHATDSLSADDSQSSMVQNNLGASTSNQMSATDSLSIIDTFQAQLGTVFIESLPVGDTLSGSGQASGATDSLSAGDAFSTQGTGVLVDALSAGDSFTMTGVTVPGENMSALDSLLASMGYVSFEAVPVADRAIDQGGYIPLDILPMGDLQSALQATLVDLISISDSLSASGTAIPSDTLSIGESLLVLDSILWVDALSVGDVFSGGSTAPGTAQVYSLYITWVTRDMKLTWVTRDMKMTFITRDVTGTFITRNEQDTFITRDEQDMFVTRGR